MLAPGDQVPFFEVMTTAGAAASYREHWQRRNLVLVRVPADPGWNEYLASIEASRAAIARHDAALVVTSDPVDGMPQAGVIIADRWGEIHYAAQAASAASPSPAMLPDADAIVEWLEYVQHKCPECEGETR
jgi:hypothetical protein